GRLGRAIRGQVRRAEGRVRAGVVRVRGRQRAGQGDGLGMATELQVGSRELAADERIAGRGGERLLVLEGCGRRVASGPQDAAQPGVLAGPGARDLVETDRLVAAGALPEADPWPVGPGGEPGLQLELRGAERAAPAALDVGPAPAVGL